MRRVFLLLVVALAGVAAACSRAESKESPASAARGKTMGPADSASGDHASPLPPRGAPPEAEVAYFAGGCFWGIQHYFKKGPGVLDAVSGYMQGTTPNPTYKQVCSDTTGHAETVKVVYDPAKITYRRLLEAFFKMHDPTQAGGQGPDIGSQYRSGIWVVSDAQRREAEAFIRELTGSKRYPKKIVTQVEPAKTFYPAEEYHQDYIAKNGAFCRVTNPW